MRSLTRVLSEIELRERYLNSVALVLDEDFALSPGEHVRKGVLHARVAERLGVRLTGFVRREINRALEVLKVRTRVRDGRWYFRDLKPKGDWFGG